MHPSRIFLSSVFLLVLFAGTPAAHAAAACPASNTLTTPTADFTIDNVNQVVTHLKTGLMWKQCAEGLSGASCTTGSATAMTWSAALSAAATPYASYSDWRLPNQKELLSIVETGCYNPSINEEAFPATPADYFWSSTAYAPLPALAWGVHFYYGDSNADGRTGNFYVRLVRGGQSFDSFDAQKVQTITFADPGAQNFGTTPTLTATSSSGLTVSFTSSTTSVCTITTGGALTFVTTGTCTINADQAGDASYYAAPQVTQNITVGQAGQTITFNAAPAISVGGTGTVSATGGASGNAVTFTVPTTTGICSVSGSTVTGIAAGTCTVAADQAGNANYSAAPQATQNIGIGISNQTISFGAAPSIVVGGTGTVSATATSGLAASFTSTTTGICTVSGSTVTGVAAGTCTIAANQAGNANYAAATQVTQNITIGQGSQNITFGAAPSVVVGGTGTVSATGGASGNAVTFTSTTTGICTVSGSTVTGVAAGTCTVAANQAGNANYTAAPQVTQNITVGNAPINGACGSANGVATAFVPSTNLCSAGSASAVTAGSSWTWSCNGSGGGTDASCSAPNQATGGGSGRAVISGGTWAVDPAQSAGFIPTSGHAKSPPGLPPGASFPYGLLDFTLNAGAPGSAATITITYPAALPAGAVYWKYGPSPDGYNCSGVACVSAHWYQMPPAQAVFAGNTVTLTITDGGVGDDDLATDSIIVDQGGPGLPGAAGIPTLSEWALLMLAGLMGMLGMGAMRRPQQRSLNT